MGKLALAAVVILVILIAAYWVKTRNQFIVLRNRIKDQWAQVDVQLKRRADLIPNLVEIAKGYAGFEKSTLEAVTQARARVMHADSMKEAVAANEALNSAVHRFFAVGESYPDLKANANFMQLQQEISVTENKIAMARQFYNDTILKYNNAIQIFPASVIAGMGGFYEIEFLSASETERENVKINAADFKF